MPIASRADKQRAIEALKNASSKYAKPFDKGEMAWVSVLAGDWKEYAAVVMDMIVADTLLEIDLRQEHLLEVSKDLLAEQRLTNRLLMRQLGITQDELDAEVAAARSSIQQEMQAHRSERRSVKADLHPRAVEILRRQAREGDEQAAEALRVRGFTLEDMDY